MATFNRNQSTETAEKKPSINRQGRSVAERAMLKVTRMVLREYKREDGFWTPTGETYDGEKCYKLIAEFNKANFERRFDIFRRDLMDLKLQDSYEVETRALNGKSVEDRANEYMAGKIMAAFNTAPLSFNIGDRQYRTETMAYTLYLNPQDAVDVVKGQKSIGSGATAELYTEPVSSINQVIDRETINKCVELFKAIMNPEVQGNRLLWNGKVVASFSDVASTLENVVLGDRHFDISEIKVI